MSILLKFSFYVNWSSDSIVIQLKYCLHTKNAERIIMIDIININVYNKTWRYWFKQTLFANTYIFHVYLQVPLH